MSSPMRRQQQFYMPKTKPRKKGINLHNDIAVPSDEEWTVSNYTTASNPYATSATTDEESVDLSEYLGPWTSLPDDERTAISIQQHMTVPLKETFFTTIPEVEEIKEARRLQLVCDYAFKVDQEPIDITRRDERESIRQKTSLINEKPKYSLEYRTSSSPMAIPNEKVQRQDIDEMRYESTLYSSDDEDYYSIERNHDSDDEISSSGSSSSSSSSSSCAASEPPLSSILKAPGAYDEAINLKSNLYSKPVQDQSDNGDLFDSVDDELLGCSFLKSYASWSLTWLEGYLFPDSKEDNKEDSKEDIKEDKDQSKSVDSRSWTRRERLQRQNELPFLTKTYASAVESYLDKCSTCDKKEEHDMDEQKTVYTTEVGEDYSSFSKRTQPMW